MKYLSYVLVLILIAFVTDPALAARKSAKSKVKAMHKVAKKQAYKVSLKKVKSKAKTAKIIPKNQRKPASVSPKRSRKALEVPTIRSPAGMAGLGLAAGAGGSLQSNKALEIRGQARTLSMMLILRNGKENLNFVKVRQDYATEIAKTEF